MNIILKYTGQISGEPIAIPASKSIAARALLLRKITHCETELQGLPDCDDTRVMARALDQLEQGASVINLEACGTAMRLLTAYFAGIEGAKVVLTGTPRLLHRPLMPLVEALRKLGAEIGYSPDDEKFEPEIEGKKLKGGEVWLDASQSSQFVSALLLASPLMKNELVLHREGDAVSVPYIKQTCEMLRLFGIDCRENGNVIIAGCRMVPPPATFRIPTDSSSLAYFYAIAAIAKCDLPIVEYQDNITQADKIAVEIIESMAAEKEIKLDMKDCPDLVPTIAATACAMGKPFVISGVEHLAIKESDRLATVASELAKAGFTLKTTSSSIAWDGKRHNVTCIPTIECHDDHRIAMAMSLLAIKCGPIQMRGIECVAKSFPDYFEQLKRAGFEWEVVA